MTDGNDKRSILVSTHFRHIQNTSISDTLFDNKSKLGHYIPHSVLPIYTASYVHDEQDTVISQPDLLCVDPVRIPTQANHTYD